MAQLTPKDILEISEPVEEIYQRTVDELLINIARHFQITGWERTRYWEIKKLSELGALTKESVDIIAKNTGMLPDEIEKAFLQVSEKACLDIDPQLRAAAEKGILQDPGTSATTSPEIRRMVSAYSAQAVDKMNMTNTTMLESTRQAYVKAVQQVVNEEELQEAKRILETQSFAVTTGTETRTRAIRKAMEDLSKTGLAGFYDRAGRAWSPEAYAAMVVRTTAHNAAVESIKERQQEFGGGDVFQISSHTGARPLCAPYQGGLYTWGRGSGTVYDGDGKAYEYESIYSTSYGEAAGIFGINCGHHPIPFISGYSFRQEGPTQTPEENAKEYEESQKQRQYERDIREAKRELAMAKELGDETAIKDAKQKVAKEQARMRAFIDQTGRARRYDREQIAQGGNVARQATIPQPIQRTDIFKNTKGLTDEFRDGMARALNNAAREDVKQLYTQYADQLVCVKADATRGAYFSRWEGGITMNLKEDEKGSDYQKPYEVVFHEFGHMIDCLAGRATGRPAYISAQGLNGKQLVDVIRKDFQTFKKSLGVSKAVEVIQVLKAENMDKYQCGNISDILEKCTGTSYPLGIGHGAKYHKRPGATETEFFTEVLSSSIVNPAGYEQMERLFPNAVALVWDMVKEVLK